MALFLSITSIFVFALMSAIQEAFLWNSIVAVIGIICILILNIIVPAPPVMFFGMIIGAIILFIFGLYVARKTINNRPGYGSIWQIAVVIRSLFSTKFFNANLTQTNFNSTHLKYADLRQTNVTHTVWRNAKYLNLARVGQTALGNLTIRNLLVSGQGENQSFIGMNLRGTNLTDANLQKANLSQADLSNALLKNANLEWAILTQTQAVGTDFAAANLTGACGLSTWNIDSTTNLESVECRWIYLLETAKPKTDDRERRPSSGEFAPNEFTSLFREVINTVDLIFRDGLDPKVFSQSLQQIQSDHQAAQLELQSLENKGDSTVIAKLRISPDANKAEIHRQFTQFYQSSIALLHQQQHQIKHHENQIQTLYEKIEQITKRPVSDRFILLQIHPGDFTTGFPVTLQIFHEDGTTPMDQTPGQLPPNPSLLQAYQYWQSAYRRSLKAARLDIPSQVTNVSSDDFFEDCLQAQHRLSQQFNQWLASSAFRPIEKALYLRLDNDRPHRLLLQTEDPHLRQLPWQTWQFFHDYPSAELALTKPNYHLPPEKTTVQNPNRSMKILAILGDSRGIDLQQDKAALKNINADVTFLLEPPRQALTQQLWSQSWDILFFAGHSHSSGTTGHLQLNPTESLAIPDIHYALKQSIATGLKLAIFNSCDGLGLANDLADLQIPQMIVMRQPVSDRVAQRFLINFLTRFSGSQPFYQSVREAREQLQDLENQYPSATWLPIIIQNPATLPLTWTIGPHE